MCSHNNQICVSKRLIHEKGSKVEFNKQPLIQLVLDADDGSILCKGFVLQDFLYGTVKVMCSLWMLSVKNPSLLFGRQQCCSRFVWCCHSSSHSSRELSKTPLPFDSGPAPQFTALSLCRHRGAWARREIMLPEGLV